MNTATDGLLLATSEVEIQAVGKPPAFTIGAYTGGVMNVPGWGSVALELSGIDATAEQVSILVDHDSRLACIVGHGKAVVAGGRLLVRGTIAGSTDAARQVVELARGGFRFQASVGIPPMEVERIRAGETARVNGPGHEGIAARARGRVQALEIARQYWEQLESEGVPVEAVVRLVVKPWCLQVGAWAEREIDPAKLDMPPLPENCIPPENRQRLDEYMDAKRNKRDDASATHGGSNDEQARRMEGTVRPQARFSSAGAVR